VSATDPRTFVAVGAILGAAAVLASLVPAIRATRVDPVEVLRAE
jgi:ABC-type lipoprotein release transport system permease subunit